MASWRLSKYIEAKLQTTFFHLILSFFQKLKRGLELVSLPHFWHNFWRKIFLLLYSINWPNVIVWLPLLCEILGNMCIAIVSKPGCDVMNFEVNLIFQGLSIKQITQIFLECESPTLNKWVMIFTSERAHLQSFIYQFKVNNWNTKYVKTLNMWNMFKVNNKNTNNILLYLLLTLNILHLFLVSLLGPALSIYKSWKNILQQLLTVYKNLSDLK